MVLLPYVIITGGINIALTLKIGTLIPLLIVGIVHTGIAYLLYFGSMKNIRAQSAALLSYIDPAFAIILSAIVLHESIGVFEIIGTALILGSAIVSELPERKIQ
ncbi:MAG: EamA family transporter [Acutalibacteraceae bacterium]